MEKIDLDKFKIHENGYLLSSGLLVTPLNVDDLNAEDTIDLCKKHSNARDALLIRKLIHNLANSMYSYMGTVETEIQGIKDSLICKVHNGDDHDEPLAVTVAKLAEQHRNLRKRERLVQSLKENAIPLLIILFLVTMGVAAATKNNWLLTVVVPIIVGIIKLFLQQN